MFITYWILILLSTRNVYQDHGKYIIWRWPSHWEPNQKKKKKIGFLIHRNKPPLYRLTLVETGFERTTYGPIPVLHASLYLMSFTRSWPPLVIIIQPLTRHPPPPPPPRVLWGGDPPSRGPQHPCGGAEQLQLLPGCAGRPEALPPERPLDRGLARQAPHGGGPVRVQEALQPAREPHLNGPHQPDPHRGGMVTPDPILEGRWC